MYVMDGIAHASTPPEERVVSAVKTLGDWMMLVTFLSGETRLFDGTRLLDYPAFQPLRDEQVFRDARVDHGVVTWLDGEIDLAPETMYAESYAYEKPAMEE